MTIYEKLSTIQQRFKSKKSSNDLNRRKVGLIHSANITSGQPKTS